MIYAAIFIAVLIIAVFAGRKGWKDGGKDDEY